MMTVLHALCRLTVDVTCFVARFIDLNKLLDHGNLHIVKTAFRWRISDGR